MMMKNKMLFMITTLGVFTILIMATNCISTRNNAKTGLLTDTLITNKQSEGLPLQIQFVKGKSHNYPLMAFWVEDAKDQYIETLYVAESIGKGVFDHGQTSAGKWMPGEIKRPAALPYWAHKRGVQTPEGLYIPTPEQPVPDAITGATPTNNFVLNTRLSKTKSRQFKLMMEINQTWDWNEYWTNNKFPGDDEYKTSAQPAIVYSATINLDDGISVYDLEPIGHSHYSGKDGSLDKDISTLTTALEIVGTVQVRFPDPVE